MLEMVGNKELLNSERIVYITGVEKLNETQTNKLVAFIENNQDAVIMTSTKDGADLTTVMNAEIENLIILDLSVDMLKSKYDYIHDQMLENGGLIIGTMSVTKFNIFDYATEMAYIGSDEQVECMLEDAKAANVKINKLDKLTRKERKALGMIEPTGIDYTKAPDTVPVVDVFKVFDAECMYGSCRDCKLAYCDRKNDIMDDAAFDEFDRKRKMRLV